MAGKQEGLLAFGEVARSAGVCEERYATHSALLGRHGGRPSSGVPPSPWHRHGGFVSWRL